MRRTCLLSLLLLTAPAVAQVTPAPSRIFPSEVALTTSAEWSELTDPFGRTGNTPFTLRSPGFGILVDSRRWYVDFAGSLLAHSVRQRRIATTADYLMVTFGPVRGGIELTYWELGFRRRTMTIGELGIETERQGRAAMGGFVVKTPGPYQTEVTCAVTAGWYANRYTSALAVDSILFMEPLVSDDATIGSTRIALVGPLIADRVRISGSARYFRLFGEHSSWAPGHEWSGEALVDIRTFAVRRKSIYVGAHARFGPSGPGLVTDKTFGLRMKWRLR